MEKANGGRKTNRVNAINMKANTQLIRKMEWAFFTGKVEMFIRDAIRMIRGTAMEKCFGLMVVVIRANGRMAYSMELAGWNCSMDELKKAILKIIFFANLLMIRPNCNSTRLNKFYFISG
jgi:hypothetical protein